MQFRTGKHLAGKHGWAPPTPPKTTGSWQAPRATKTYTSTHGNEEIVYKLPRGTRVHYITESYVKTNRNADMSMWVWEPFILSTTDAFYTSKDMIERGAKIRIKDLYGKNSGNVGHKDGMTILRLPKNAKEIAFIAVSDSQLLRTDTNF